MDGGTKGKGKGRNRFKIRGLLADERCTGAILTFLRTTEVGTRVGPRTGAAPTNDKDREEGSV